MVTAEREKNSETCVVVFKSTDFFTNIILRTYTPICVMYAGLANDINTAKLTLPSQNIHNKCYNHTGQQFALLFFCVQFYKVTT